MNRIFTLLFSACLLSLQAQTNLPHVHYVIDSDAAERQHSVDIAHMKVEVSFEPTAGKVIGKVTHTFTTIQNNIDTLFFDAPSITILSAEMDGKAVPYNINKEGVVLRFSKKLMWDETHTVIFTYTATPQKGIYFIGWNQPENQGKPDINYIRKQIWTQGQGIDNRYWIPMYDCMNDKFTTETVVTIESKYKCLSNGKKISTVDNGNGTSTWHYMMEKPHAGYLLMLGIGNYEIKETKTKRGTPVQFWYYPEFKDRVEYTSLHTERMIELLEDETGTPYPWGTYSQIMVQNFLYGAMENTTATVFGDFFSTDGRGFKDRNYLGVNCHELTHQWFGDLITARSGNDGWLQESFATFFPKLFFRSLEGEDAYQWGMRGEYNAALAQSEKDLYPVRHTRSGTARWYQKGSAVIGMLHYQLGEENFRRFIQHYLSVNGFKNVESWDFQKALKDKLGLNYDWFFDQWIHRGGEPHYKVSYEANDKEIVFQIEQTHKTDGNVRYFKMPVDFAIYYKDGRVDRKTLWVMDTASQTIRIANEFGGEVDFALFDEESKVLKKIEFKKSNAALFAQAAKAKYMIDRYDAVVAMKDIPLVEKQAFLQGRFVSEKHHAIRAEIAKQLANQKHLNKWYLQVVKDSKSEVKLAFIAADSTISDQKDLFFMLLKDSSNIVVEQALEKMIKSSSISTKDKISALKMTELLSGQNNNIRAKWLEFAYTVGYGDKSKHLAELSMLTGANYEFRTRVNAAQAIKRLNVCDAGIVNNLLDACLTYNSRLAGPSNEVLKSLKKDANYNAIIQAEIAKLDASKQAILKTAGLKD